MFALDTNTIIHFFKKKGRVFENFELHESQQFFIPSIVLYELQVGVLKSESPKLKAQQLNTLTHFCTEIPFSQKEAHVAAQIRSDLEKKGASIGPLDILIAASALSQGLTLVTHNTKEFRRIRGLKVVDWY